MFQVKLAFLSGCAYVSLSTYFNCFIALKLIVFKNKKKMSDSMEMMVLSILSPALSCDWGISQWEKAMMTTVSIF